MDTTEIEQPTVDQEHVTLKFYLVAYSYVDEDFGLQHWNDPICENPFDWIISMRQTNRFEHKNGRKRHSNFVLLNYWEITEEEFDKLQDKLHYD